MKKGATGTETRFTCLVEYKFIHVIAEDHFDANEKNEEESDLIIRGLAGNIGARRVPFKKVPGHRIYKLEEEKKLKERARCTITVGDSVRIKIANAIYRDREEVNDYAFLVFEKNGIRFWTYSYGTFFSSIDGKRV